MQGVTFSGSQSAYSHQNQGSGDQYSHMSDIERRIMQFLQSQNGGEGVHVAAIGRAIKADPPIVRSVFSFLLPVLHLNCMRSFAQRRTRQVGGGWRRVHHLRQPLRRHLDQSIILTLPVISD